MFLQVCRHHRGPQFRQHCQTPPYVAGPSLSTCIALINLSSTGYAKFGTITSPAGPSDVENISEGTSQATDNTNSTHLAGPQNSLATQRSILVTSTGGDPHKPTQRVRQAPGRSHNNIFGYADDDDALASAPPKPVSSQVMMFNQNCRNYVASFSPLSFSL
jgi:hypothetical protein